MNYFEKMLPREELEQLNYIPTIPQFVEWIEEKWSALPAVSDTVNTWTYREMCGSIGRKRALLNAAGLSKGDTVAVLDNATVNALEMFLAITSAGYTAIMLPAQLPAQAVAGCCQKFRIKVLALGKDFPASSYEVPCKVISVSDRAETPDPVAVVDKEDPAAIFFTGGTTGAPKGAVLPHRAIMRGSLNGCYAPGSQLGRHVYAQLLPLSHVFGLIRGMMSALYTGSEWVAADNIKATIGSIPKIRPTILVIVPGICEILMGLVKMNGRQFLGGRLDTIISGAANVPPKLIEEYDRIGIKLFAGYGMTEGANLTSGNIDVKAKPTSVGMIYPGQETKVVDGELWFRGDNLFLGYYGDPEKTAQVLTPDGWLRTGDLVRFDEQGYMYIVGRIKNLIILPNGENVSPEEIEEKFYACPKLKDCIVREDNVEGTPIIAIEILPRADEFKDVPWSGVEEYFTKLTGEINAGLPSTHRISKVTVRKEDFKRTGAMKVSRN